MYARWNIFKTRTGNIPVNRTILYLNTAVCSRHLAAILLRIYSHITEGSLDTTGVSSINQWFDPIITNQSNTVFNLKTLWMFGKIAVSDWVLIVLLSSCFLFSLFGTPGLDNWIAQASESQGRPKCHDPRKSLSWTVSIPLSEHRNIDLFSQSVLEQTHEGQVQWPDTEIVAWCVVRDRCH